MVVKFRYHQIGNKSIIHKFQVKDTKKINEYIENSLVKIKREPLTEVTSFCIQTIISTSTYMFFRSWKIAREDLLTSDHITLRAPAVGQEISNRNVERWHDTSCIVRFLCLGGITTKIFPLKCKFSSCFVQQHLPVHYLLFQHIDLLSLHVNIFQISASLNVHYRQQSTNIIK